MTRRRKPDAPICTAADCTRWLLARGLCPAHLTAVEQAIASGRTDEWILRRHGVPVEAVEAVCEHLDRVNADPEVKAEMRQLLHDLEVEVVIVAENAAAYRSRNRPFPRHPESVHPSCQSPVINPATEGAA